VIINRDGRELFAESRAILQRSWSETSYQVASLRDNADCVDEEFARVSMPDAGLSAKLSFDPRADISAPYIASGVKPRVAIVREQGVNSHLEMAAAFDRAGFTAVDVHMSDLLAGRRSLADFSGMVACGGFSYGDVLGAGEGWAKTVLFNEQIRDQFQQFFHRSDTFSLGVCNGCQMLSNLKSLIPGAELWPRFVRNLSEQFEARFSLVRIEDSQSVLLKGMAGSYMPIAVSHGEGRAEFASSEALVQLQQSDQIAMRFLENNLEVASRYPANPNGSPDGITGVTSVDGRATLMMPHPERVFRTVANSWHPDDWGEDSGWMRLFRNARTFAD
jgi:phosphoribosylformylglycinamidine synthase